MWGCCPCSSLFCCDSRFSGLVTSCGTWCNARWFYCLNIWKNKQTDKKQAWKMTINFSAVSLRRATVCRDQIVWNVGAFFAFFLTGMRITLAWRRWCRCSVKWSWSSHCSSWMQTWTPRTISQHYFPWVLLHLTLLWACLLVCQSLPGCPR